MEEKKLLEVKNLKVSFFTQIGIVNAVDDVSFNVYSDKIIGIVGESGCGKTVTVCSIMNILPPNGKIMEGKINYYRKGNAIEISSTDPKGKMMREIRGKEIAIIFQEPMSYLSPVYTVGNQIMEGLMLYYPKISKKESRERAIELLSDVGIQSPEKRIDSYVFELSGGMAQRVIIAMAISGKPRILIADEPTTAIDVTLQAKVLELLKEIKQKNKMSVVIISHNMGVISQIADEVLVMYLGLVVEKGKTKDIFKNPMHPYTRDLLKSIPKLNDRFRSKLKTIKGSIPNQYLKRTACPYKNRCSEYSKCKVREVPDMVEIEKEHFVRCLLYRK